MHPPAIPPGIATRIGGLPRERGARGALPAAFRNIVGDVMRTDHVIGRLRLGAAEREAA